MFTFSSLRCADYALAYQCSPGRPWMMPMAQTVELSNNGAKGACFACHPFLKARQCLWARFPR
jgi:hypothetical protein